MSLTGQPHDQRLHPLHRAMPVVLHFLSEEGVDLRLASLAVTGQNFHDSVCMPQVDLVGEPLVFTFLAELLQLLPAERLIPR